MQISAKQCSINLSSEKTKQTFESIFEAIKMHPFIFPRKSRIEYVRERDMVVVVGDVSQKGSVRGTFFLFFFLRLRGDQNNLFGA